MRTQFNPRLVTDIPLSQGTMNIAVLPAMAAPGHGSGRCDGSDGSRHITDTAR